MPKDNRNTLAAFDDLLASLEGIVDDNDTSKDASGDVAEPSSAVDNEFYDFYFEINNVPRKASNASSNPPKPAPTYEAALVSSSVPPTPPAPPTSTSSNQRPVAPTVKPQIGFKHKPAQHKPAQLKSPPLKPNPNRSNLSIKKPATSKPKGSALRVNPPTSTPAAPYEAPQRFLSRGSYNSGASQVDAPAPPPPKEIPPQRFMSTGSYITTPPVQQPPPSFTPAKEPPQRFYSTNNFTSRPQPTAPSRETPQRFMSTNSFAPRDEQVRNTYIGNRPSRNSPLPQTFKQFTPEPYAPAPPQPYTPPPQPYNPPSQSFANPPSQSYNPPPQPYFPPQPYNPPSQSYTPQQPINPPSQSYYPSQQPPYYPSNPTPSPSYNPPDAYGDRDRRGSARMAPVNSRKSVRMPKSTLPKASNNICAKCGNHIEGEHVMALNNFWCLDHFACRDCGLHLHGVFSEEDGHPYCSDCMANKYRCVTCGRGVTSGQFYQTENGRRHAECMPAITCDVCHNPIRPGTPKMRALDKTFHPECFRCTSCGRQIEGEFTNRSGKPICMLCSHSNQPKCAKCHNSISGQYVAYSSMRYHHDCFTCAQCGARLSLDAFYASADKNYCEYCIKSVVR